MYQTERKDFSLRISAMGRKISVEDIYRLKSVSSVEMFDSEAVFAVKGINREKNRYISNIYMLSNGEIRRFTSGESMDTKPKWHPRGEGIFFVSNRDETSQVYYIKRDGGESDKITELPEGNVLDYTVSPDGDLMAIVFLEKPEFMKKEARKFRKEKNLSNPPMEITTLFYKLDGMGYILDRRPKIVIWNVKTGEKKIVDLEGKFWINSVVFSNDGKKIYFIASSPEELRNMSYIKVYDLERDEIHDITPIEGPKSNLIYVSENELAFLGHDDPTDGWGTRNMHLWIFDIGSGKARNLTSDLDNSIGYSLLSDTSEFGEGGGLRYVKEKFYFILTEKGNANIYEVDLDGNFKRVFDFRGGINSFDTDGKIFIFSASTITVPPEIWIYDGGIRKLSDFNSWVRDVEVYDAEEFWIDNDDVKIHTWVMKPKDLDEEKKYPAILYIHGGPHAAYGNVFFHEFQLTVANGYILVFSNPRGSKGYGERFAKDIKGDWGNKDYSDIMKVADFIENLPYVDPKKIGLTGGSYGGYMTNWILGKTDRFKAAITDRSVVNLLSMMGTSDFPFSPDMYWEGDFWDRIEKLWERSPIRLAKNIKTPLLIIHSEGDYRCPISEAEQLFKALKTLGKEVVFIRYPGETSHGLSRSGPPDLRIDRLRRYLDWWGKYLSS